MKLKHILNAVFLLFLVGGTVYILRRHDGLELQTSEGPVYGTVYHVQYEHDAQLDEEILRVLKTVDFSLSMFNDSSTVSRINRGGVTGGTDSLFREVFTLSERISDDTGGAFDVTVAPLVNAWGFGFKSGNGVTPDQVDSLKAFVGYQKVRLDGNLLVKEDARTMMDFSSVAKGYAVDCVAKLLDEHGIRNYMIEIGGEVTVKGLHPERRPWYIGISKPVENGASALQTMLTLTNVSMATSGNYRRFYERDGRKYAHTIDPKTGAPVQHELLSATVLAPDCATADAYATAFMVLGLEESRKVLARHPELSAYLIYTGTDGKYAVWTTENMRKYLKDEANSRKKK